MVSIIVPFYNEEKNIEKCINNILLQEYKDFELILVDDGSDDNGADICKKYTEVDNRIRLISKERGGVAKARNAGIDAACGQYIWMIDADDQVPSRALVALVNGIEKNDNVDICIARFEVDGNQFEASRTGLYSQKDYISEMINETGYYYYVVWNKLYRASVIKENGIYFEDMFFSEDGVFNLDVVPYINKVMYVDDIVYKYTEGIGYNKKTPKTAERQKKIYDYYLIAFNKKLEIINKFDLKECEKAVYRDLFYSLQNSLREMITINHPDYKEAIKEIWNNENTKKCIFYEGLDGKAVKIARLSYKTRLMIFYKLYLKVKK